jgi:wyosine [tRNA(Phe)-imidazoG37] synthetase (radical SAM superfamily)
VSKLAVEAGVYGAEMHRALRLILAKPYGCVFCDSGTLRNTTKDHDTDCGFALAQKIIFGSPTNTAQENERG